MSRKGSSSQATESQRCEPPAAVQTKQQPPSAGHRAALRTTKHESARVTLALIHTKIDPHVLHNC